MVYGCLAFCAVMFMIMIYLIIDRIHLKKHLRHIETQHHQDIQRQMINLKKICHNINTPLNSIMTIFEFFNKRIYGELPQEYAQLIIDAYSAVNDLRDNTQDIQQYCNECIKKNNFSICQYFENEKQIFDNPYVLKLNT